MEAQSTEIDGVTGATVTVNSVRRAANACIAQAKGETVLIAEEVASNYGTFDENGFYVPDFLQKQEPISEDQYTEELSADVVIIGMGSAGIHAARAAMLFEPGQAYYATYVVDMLNASGKVTTRFKTWGRQLLMDDTGRVVRRCAGHRWTLHQDQCGLWCHPDDGRLLQQPPHARLLPQGVDGVR